MITDKLIQAVETELDTKWDSHIVPEGEAYPTSGQFFMKVTGEATEIDFTEAMFKFKVVFQVTCSVRTRHYPVHAKRVPYLALIDLQEKAFLHLISSNDLLVAIKDIPGVSSTTGRITSTLLRTLPTVVGPSYFNSTDYDSSTREAGYTLTQSYSSPEIHMGLECLTLDPALE